MASLGHNELNGIYYIILVMLWYDIQDMIYVLFLDKDGKLKGN